MADYKKMYHILFREMNETIDRFQKTLLKVEDIYIETDFEAFGQDEEQVIYHPPTKLLYLDSSNKKIEEKI